MTGDSGDFSRGMDGGMGDGEGFKYYFLQRMADRYAEIKGRRSSGDGEDSSAAESASGDASRPFVGVWNAPTFGIGGLLEASAQRLTIDDKGHWVVKAHGSVEDVEPYAWLDQQLRNLPGTAFFGDSGERKTWWDANMPLQGEFSQVPVGKTKLGRQIWEHPLSLAFSSLEGVSALQHHHDGNANGVLLSFADGKLTSRTEATLVEIGWSQEAVRELNTRLDSLLQTYKEGGNAGTKEALLTIAQHAEEVGNFIETQNKAALERNVDALVHHIYQQVPGTDREDVKIVVQDSFQKKGALDAEPMQQLLSRLISSGLDPRQVNNDLKLALGKLHEAHKRNDITQELGFSFQALSVINPDVARADEGYKAIRDTLSGEPDVWKGFDVFSRELRMHLERAQSVSEGLERIGLKDIPKVRAAMLEYQTCASLCERVAHHIERAAKYLGNSQKQAESMLQAALLYKDADAYLETSRRLIEHGIHDKLGSESTRTNRALKRIDEDLDGAVDNEKREKWLNSEKNRLTVYTLELDGNLAELSSRAADHVEVQGWIRICLERTVKAAQVRIDTNTPAMRYLQNALDNPQSQSGWLSFRAAKYHDHASRHYKALAEQKDLSLDDQRKLEQEVRNQLEKAIKHYDNAVTTLEQTAVSLRKEKVLHPRQAGDFESQAGRAEHAAAKCSKNKAELEADKAELEYREALRQHGKNYVEGEAHSEAETTAKHALDTAAENRRHAIEQKKIEEQKYSALGYGDAQERDQATGSDAGGRPPGGPPSGGLPPGGDGGSAGSGSGRGRDRPSSWRPLGGDGAETPFAERYRQTLIEAATGKEFDIVRLFGVVDAESNRLLEHVEDLKGSEYAVYNKYQKMLGHAGQVAVIRALNATEKDFISGVVHNEAAMKMLLKNLQESKRASVDVADKLIASIGRDDSTVLAALREDMATFLKGDKVTVATDRAQEILNASDPEELAEKLRDFVEYLRDNMDVQKILHDKDITDEVKEVITTYWTMFADNFKLEFTEAAKAVAEQIRRDVQHEMLDRQEAFALRMQKRWAVVSCISIFCGILSPNSLANTMINVGFTPLQRAIP